ncbi:Riboflavin synthase alpha chain [Perkinsus chesapeaki]|uniref:Riboflavin synthase n=1 Tax=Perkinsus chesapeaki TaxID=330153 RepID=A0A7J6LGP2_PERCH|nr:Riboflavin synthase alpha chain [Perkinsus chesapeaki]
MFAVFLVNHFQWCSAALSKAKGKWYASPSSLYSQTSSSPARCCIMPYIAKYNTCKVNKVNVERALAADARNSGHVVQGHVDGTGVVEEKWKDGESIRVRIRAFPEVLPAYIVPKGFIAMDGVSLTVCEVCPKTCTFTIMLVPHTQSVITLPHKPIGARVNLEVDCMAKYAAAAPTQALAPVSSYQLMGLAFTSAVLGGLIAVSLVLALAKKFCVDLTDAAIGRGAFSEVRKGLDLLTGEAVAIKTYTATSQKAIDYFTREVRVLDMLKAGAFINLDISTACACGIQARCFELLAYMESNKPGYESRTSKGPVQGHIAIPEWIDDDRDGGMFIRLLSFTTTETGAPGPDSHGNLIIVMEMGVETLESYVRKKRTELPGSYHFATDELGEIVVRLIDIMEALHSLDMVHLDLKAENVMRMRDGQWKLIDLGGLMLDGTVISPASGGSITFTPVYASPELGRPMAAYLSGISGPDDEKQIIKIAKSMDVWALGILISKIVLGKEPTAELWTNCMSVAESGSSGEADFYHSVIRYFHPKVSVGKRLAEIDPDLAELVLQMMVTDEKARATIGVLRGHR